MCTVITSMIGCLTPKCLHSPWLQCTFIVPYKFQVPQVSSVVLLFANRCHEGLEFFSVGIFIFIFWNHRIFWNLIFPISFSFGWNVNIRPKTHEIPHFVWGILVLQASRFSPILRLFAFIDVFVFEPFLQCLSMFQDVPTLSQ